MLGPRSLFALLSVALAACTSPTAEEDGRDDDKGIDVPPPSTDVDFGRCNAAHDAPFATERVIACPDLDRDGFRGPTAPIDCGLEFADHLSDGCAPLYDPDTLEEAHAAQAAYLADPIGHPYVEEEWLSPVDCDDDDASVAPGAADEPNDGVDQDCDGHDPTITLYVDADHDGYPMDPAEAVGMKAPIVCGPTSIEQDDVCRTGIKSGWYWIPLREDGLLDCRDDQPTFHPGGEDLRVNGFDATIDRYDTNCDGHLTCPVDTDGDGQGTSVIGVEIMSPDLSCFHPGMSWDMHDCDDSRSTTYLGAPETFDGIDNNCDHNIDEATCVADYTLTIHPGYELFGWRADLLVGAFDATGAPIEARIRVNGGPAKNASGYNPHDWVAPTSGPFDVAPDVSVWSTTRSVTLTLESLEVPADLYIGGDYFLGVSQNLYGWLRRVIQPTDSPSTAPFELTGYQVTCPGLFREHGDVEILNNDLHFHLRL